MPNADDDSGLGSTGRAAGEFAGAFVRGIVDDAAGRSGPYGERRTELVNCLSCGAWMEETAPRCPICGQEYEQSNERPF